MTTNQNNLPAWIGNVPLRTAGVLAAVHIFGKNIESRQIVLAGKRYFHNAVENVVGYVLNPILPPLHTDGDLDEEAVTALRNIRDCFNYIFQIQIEYFKILTRLRPERFRNRKTGAEFNLNQFAAKSPTLLNSEKRYLILSKVDGAQPFDLDINWNAEFDWVDDTVRVLFHKRLLAAQEAYADILQLGEWYASRDKNLIIPIRTIMDDLSEYFEHLGLAAYLMARKSHKRNGDADAGTIRNHLIEACRHLGRFAVDLLRMSVFSIVKHDLAFLGDSRLDAVIRTRAEDESFDGPNGFEIRHQRYGALLDKLYAAIGYAGVRRRVTTT